MKLNNEKTEKIKLNHSVSNRVTQLMYDIQPYLKGAKLKREHVLNYVLERADFSLSDTEIETLIDNNGDRLGGLTWLLRELKTAQSQNDQVKISLLIKDINKMSQKALFNEDNSTIKTTKERPNYDEK